MFKVVATGTNENYGKKGEVRYIDDNHAKVGVERGWLEPNMEYIGRTIHNKTMLLEMIARAHARIKFEQLKIDEWQRLLDKLEVKP
jgi:hypothetical protein